MFSYSMQKEKELKIEEEKTNNGLNIDNYVNTLMFDNAVVTQNIRLYKNYLKVFHKYHNTYLNRLHIKLGIMWGQINQDIRLSSTTSNDKINTNDMIVNKNKPLSPKISTSQQAELYKFMKESGCDNDNFRAELDTIISHISSDGDDLDEINLNLNIESSHDLPIDIKENNKKINIIKDNNKINVTMDVEKVADKIINQEPELQQQLETEKEFFIRQGLENYPLKQFLGQKVAEIQK